MRENSAAVLEYMLVFELEGGEFRDRRHPLDRHLAKRYSHLHPSLIPLLAQVVPVSLVRLVLEMVVILAPA